MKKEKTKKPLSLFSFIRPYKFLLFLRIIGALAAAAVEIALALLLVYLVDSSISGDRGAVFNTIYILGAVIGAGVLLSVFNRLSSGLLGVKSARDMRQKVVHHINRLPAVELEKRHTGDLLSLLSNDVSIVAGFLEEGLPALIFQPVRFLGAFAFLLYVNWKLLLFSMLIIPAALFAAHIFSKPLGRYVEELQGFLGKMNSIVQDMLGGIFVVKAFNLKGLMLGKYKGAVEDALEKSLKIERRISMMAPVNVITQLLPFILCILFGGYLAIQGQITVGILLAFIQLMNYLVEPMQYIPALIAEYKGARGAGSRMLEILDQEVEREDGEMFSVKSYNYPIEIENAAFSYDGENRVLDGLSLKVGLNMRAALVGPSGCGKSTVLKLICGFCNLQEGSLKLFGQELNEWELTGLRSKFSVVSQDTYLFPDTIAENIAYGRVGASLEEVVEAAKAANAHDFIMELPEGYATLVGERGARLSGGQRQRLAIARAVLKDSPVILLDEPTSALDMESEAVVQEALERIMNNRTVLTVAHRLSSIRNADRIYVMDKGSIAETGSHEELLAAGGLYARLYKRQEVLYEAISEDFDLNEEVEGCPA